MINFITSLFSSGMVNSLEKIALEAIETDKESEEAKAIRIKTLDPNGMMRRDLSRFASKAYGFYLISTVVLIFIYAFIGTGGEVVGATDQAAQIKEPIAEAVHAMKELFLPITTAWGGIVSASFGVNLTNSIKGR